MGAEHHVSVFSLQQNAMSSFWGAQPGANVCLEVPGTSSVCSLPRQKYRSKGG